jgi:hypothetical protein
MGCAKVVVRQILGPSSAVIFITFAAFLATITNGSLVPPADESNLDFGSQKSTLFDMNNDVGSVVSVFFLINF